MCVSLPAAISDGTISSFRGNTYAMMTGFTAAGVCRSAASVAAKAQDRDLRVLLQCRRIGRSGAGAPACIFDKRVASARGSADREKRPVVVEGGGLLADTFLRAPQPVGQRGLVTERGIVVEKQGGRFAAALFASLEFRE